MGARFPLFELLLTLCCCRHVQPSAFTRQFSQSTVELLPCDERNSTVWSLYNSTMVTIMANLSRCQGTDEMTVTVSQSLIISRWSIFNEASIYFIKKCPGYQFDLAVLQSALASTLLITASPISILLPLCAFCKAIIIIIIIIIINIHNLVFA